MMKAKDGGTRKFAARAEPTKQQRRWHVQQDNVPADEKIDESLVESFPASDPPSWTVVTRAGGPK